MTMTADLLQAVAARESCRAALATALEATERARSTATAAESEVDRLAAADRAAIERHISRLERWTLEGGTGAPPVLVADVAHQQSKATADATLRATGENVTRFERAAANAQSELTAAEAAVRAAAKAAVRAEVLADFAELQRVNARRAELRERLLGAYLAEPAALPAREWLRVDDAGEHSAAAMSVGMPLVGISFHEAGALGGDPRPGSRPH